MTAVVSLYVSVQQPGKPDKPGYSENPYIVLCFEMEWNGYFIKITQGMEAD